MIHEQTSKELSVNTTLSHYRIISKLGAGGMGEVYRARDARLDRDVAIKVLPASLSNDEDRLKRFEQEARATSWVTSFHVFDVTPDVQGFLIGTLISEAKASRPTVILNWDGGNQEVKIRNVCG